MASVPLRPTRNNHIALNRGLARLATGAKELMEIQMAIEAQARITISNLIAMDRFASNPRLDPVDSLRARLIWLWKERHTFQRLAAVEAPETFGVEAYASCCHNAPRDGQRACLA